jgi:hypothetical protein
MVKHSIISTNFKAFAGVDTMDEFIKELNPNLDYLEHEIIGNEIFQADQRSDSGKWI